VAAKLDKEVETQELKLKKKLLAAKQEREKGDKLEDKVRKDVEKVDIMRDKAEKLRKESDLAKQKFVAEV
jgi:hypothetical protein